ncbi:MAG: HD domain-containing protein [Deltaproteobacteria bacterium]|nr:HD domain-containing protein [Deltaproteobacteria bacterium]
MIIASEIESLLSPWLQEITRDDWRQMVVDTWVLGCREGRWESVEDLARMPFTLLTPTHGITFLEHTLAVTAGAVGLYEGQKRHYARMPYPVDRDLLVAGGLLHDVGKLLETEPDGQGGFRQSRSGRCARHPFSGAILAGKVGCPDDLINVIACHAREGEGKPQRLETVLVHQADFATFDPLVMMASGRLIL